MGCNWKVTDPEHLSINDGVESLVGVLALANVTKHQASHGF